MKHFRLEQNNSCNDITIQIKSKTTFIIIFYILRNHPFHLTKAREGHKEPEASLEDTTCYPGASADTFEDSSSYLAAAVVPKQQVAEEAEQRKLGQPTALGSSAFQASRETEAERSGLASLGTTESSRAFGSFGASGSSEASNPWEGGNSTRALHELEH